MACRFRRVCSCRAALLLATLAVGAVALLPAAEATRTLSDIVHPQVAGGTSAPPGRLSYQLRLDVKGQPCGGALLRADVAVTTASCLGKSSASGVTVTAGATTTTDGQAFSVKRVLVHPYWDSKAGQSNDVALLFLDSCVNMGDQATPIAVATPAEFTAAQGSEWIVSGWGTQSVDGSAAQSGDLQYGVVQYKAPSDCSGMAGFDENSMICVGGTAAAQGTGGASLQGPCAGDQGGPLMAGANSTSAADTLDADKDGDRLVGLVSWLEGCGAPDKPVGVYTNVANLHDWIVFNMDAAKSPCGTGSDMWYDTVDAYYAFNAKPSKSQKLKDTEDIDTCLATCQAAAAKKAGGCTGFSMTYKETPDTYIYTCWYFSKVVPAKVCTESDTKGVCNQAKYLPWGSYRVGYY